MSFEEVYDDLGTARRPFRVVACIPVLGRLPLLRHTIQRLYKKNGVYKVICVGDRVEDKKLCESVGAHWVTYKNIPLGAKWNRAFQEAEQFDPDACLFVGSSDWMSDNWIWQMRPYLNDYDLTGTLGCHFIHLNDQPRLVYWPGYNNSRKGESIGIGRMISRRMLDRMQFKPFNDRMDSSLDHSMQQTVTHLAGRVHVVSNIFISSVSISTDIWPNKHQFEQHWSGELPSQKIENVLEWIENNYPEAIKVCESLKDTSVKA